MSMNAKTLQERVKKVRRKQGEVLRARYKLARSLGFSSIEARLLCMNKEETILKIAAEMGKDKKNGGDNE